MTALPDLERFRQLRPDLTFPSPMQSTAVYVMALKAMHDLGIPATEEALLEWVAEQYPDPRRVRRGRPNLTRSRAHTTYIEAVRARRDHGLPAETDEHVAEELGITSRTIGTWREKFGIPYASDVE